MKYLLFGTGDYYTRYEKWFSRDDIIALIDNNKSKQGTYIDGIPVISVEDGIRSDFDAVIILSFYVSEMKKQLIDFGISDNKIYHFYDLHKLFSYENDSRPIRYFNQRPGLKDVLLLSHDLSLGGPALALLHMGEVLRDEGYQVTFCSMEDGPLRDQLCDEGFSVVIDDNMQIFSMRECAWTEEYRLVVANTINFHYFLSDRNTNVRIIWWLHDSEFFYHGVDKQLLHDLDMTNLHICSVGPVPAAAFKIYRPDVEISDLNYSVIDEVSDVAAVKRVHLTDGKIHFTTIGYIEWRKGQDLLVDAIEQMPHGVRDKCDFTFVGADSSAMAVNLKERTSEWENVMFTGKVNRDRIHEILAETDILVVPSREDPMPTVAAEAMMHGVPCLLSNATGTAEYIDNKRNGLLFNSEDVDDLQNKLVWCCRHINEIKGMSVGARKVYEDIFSIQAFKGNLEKIMNRVQPNGDFEWQDVIELILGIFYAPLEGVIEYDVNSSNLYRRFLKCNYLKKSDSRKDMYVLSASGEKFMHSCIEYITDELTIEVGKNHDSMEPYDKVAYWFKDKYKLDDIKDAYDICDYIVSNSAHHSGNLKKVYVVSKGYYIEKVK